MPFCSNCGSKLADRANVELPVKAHIEIGAYCYEKDMFAYEADHPLMHCLNCDAVSVHVDMTKQCFDELEKEEELAV